MFDDVMQLGRKWVEEAPIGARRYFDVRIETAVYQEIMIILQLDEWLSKEARKGERIPGKRWAIQKAFSWNRLMLENNPGSIVRDCKAMIERFAQDVAAASSDAEAEQIAAGKGD